MKNSGFTLVELVMVIAITGVLAATLVIFVPPAVDSYSGTRRRAEMTDMVDVALRQIEQDVRRAVPNSVIRHSVGCIQLVPAIAGGRYRMAADTANPAGGSAWLDTTTAVTQFDVLTPLRRLPAANDWIVIDNHNADDVYKGINRQRVNSVTTPAAANGVHRIGLQVSTQFPQGYDGGRFLVVANSEQSVFYNCIFPGGGATGKLYRTVAGFDATAASCATAGSLVASDVQSCVFSYNAGATQQSGLIWMELQLLRDGERIMLSRGTHVENVP